jgi:hypothetical protein
MLLRDLWFISMSDVVLIVLVICAFLPFMQVFHTTKNMAWLNYINKLYIPQIKVYHTNKSLLYESNHQIEMLWSKAN